MKKAIVFIAFLMGSTLCFGQAASTNTKVKEKPKAPSERFVIKKRSGTKAVYHKPKKTNRSVITKRQRSIRNENG